MLSNMKTAQSFRLKQFGQRMRELREEQGLTLRRLDQLTGISKEQLGNIERGTADNPTVETVAAIASVLGAELILVAFEDFPLTLLGADSTSRVRSNTPDAIALAV